MVENPLSFLLFFCLTLDVGEESKKIQIIIFENKKRGELFSCPSFFFFLPRKTLTNEEQQPPKRNRADGGGGERTGGGGGGGGGGVFGVAKTIAQ